MPADSASLENLKVDDNDGSDSDTVLMVSPFYLTYRVYEMFISHAIIIILVSRWLCL